MLIYLLFGDTKRSLMLLSGVVCEIMMFNLIF